MKSITKITNIIKQTLKKIKFNIHFAMSKSLTDFNFSFRSETTSQESSTESDDNVSGIFS